MATAPTTPVDDPWAQFGMRPPDAPDPRWEGFDLEPSMQLMPDRPASWRQPQPSVEQGLARPQPDLRNVPQMMATTQGYEPMPPDYGAVPVDRPMPERGPDVPLELHILGAVERGFASGVASLPKAVAIAAKNIDSLFPEGWQTYKDKDVQDLVTYRLGAAIQEWVDKNVPQDPELRKSFWAETLPRGAGSFGTFLVGGAMAGAFGATRLPTVLAMGSGMGASELYDDAKAHGATDQQARWAANVGFVVGTSEALPVLRVFRRFDKASGGVFGKALSRILGNKAGQVASAGAAGAVEEGLQEFFQSTAGNATALLIYDKERKLLDGAYESGAAGGIVGSAANIIMTSLGIRARRFAAAQPEVAARLAGKKQPSRKDVAEVPGLEESSAADRAAFARLLVDVRRQDLAAEKEIAHAEKVRGHPGRPVEAGGETEGRPADRGGYVQQAAEARPEAGYGEVPREAAVGQKLPEVGPPAAKEPKVGIVPHPALKGGVAVALGKGRYFSSSGGIGGGGDIARYETAKEAVAEVRRRGLEPPETVAVGGKELTELPPEAAGAKPGPQKPQKPQELPIPPSEREAVGKVKPTEPWQAERWDSAKLGQRAGWALRVGWTNKQGKLTRTGERIAESKWKDLSAAARKNVAREIAKDYPQRAAASAEPSPTAVEQAKAEVERKAVQPAKPHDPFTLPVSMAPTGAKPISDAEVLTTIEHDYKVPVRTGRVSTSAAYKRHAEVIRLRRGVTPVLSYAAHELGHHIDKTAGPRAGITETMSQELRSLDYGPEREGEAEGFGEFVRLLLTDDVAQQEAPAFYAHFRDKWAPKHPEATHKLAATKRQIGQWRQEGAHARVGAKIVRWDYAPKPLDISRIQWFRERFSDAMERLYTAWKDEGRFMSLFQKEAVKRGTAIREGTGPYDLYMAFTQAGPRYAQRAIQKGVYAISAANWRKQLGPSMPEVFAELDAAEFEEWEAFATARHARTLWEPTEEFPEGRNPGISKADADYIHDALKREDPEKFKRFVRITQKFTEYNRALVDMLADASVATPQVAAAVKGSSETYVPLLREKKGLLFRSTGAVRGRRFVNTPSPLKRLYGSNLPIRSPVQVTIARTVQWYTRAMEQQVVEAMIDAYEKTGGLGGYMERVSPTPRKTVFNWSEIEKQFEKYDVDLDALKGAIEPDDAFYIWRTDWTPRGGESVVRAMRKGEMQLYHIDPDLYRAVAGIDILQLPWVLEPIAMATRMIKLGATALNPNFGVRNPIKDYPTYLMQAIHAFATKKKGPVAKAGAVASGLAGPAKGLGVQLYTKGAHLIGKPGDPIAEMFQDMGVDLATILGLDRRSIVSKVKDVVNDSTKRRMYKVVADPVDALKATINVTEAMTRTAEFEASLKADGWTRERIKAEGDPPRDVLVRAAMAANDALVNFKRMGYYGKPANRLVPFFNPALEAPDKFYRMWRDHPKKAAFRTAVMMAAAAAIWWYRKDDDDYKDQPPWLKYGFTTITDDDGKPVVRIPNPFEWGWAIIGGTQAILNAAYEKNPKEVTDWFNTMVRVLRPGVDVALVTTSLETFFNWDTFRDRPIETQGMRSLLPEDRAHPYNTELMKEMGKILGWSPARMEHFVNGITGGLYRTAAVPIEKTILGKRMEMVDIPGPGGLMLRKDYSRSVQEFYEQRRQIRQEYNSARRNDTLTPKLKKRYWDIQAASDVIGDLRDLLKDVEGRDERFAVEKYIIGVARLALKKPGLERYPLRVPRGELPEFQKELARRIATASKDAARQIDRGYRKTRRVEETYAQREERIRKAVEERARAKARLKVYRAVKP